ncbi:lantibiotic dehydratase family protein [Flavobacterium hydrophilum]|uniref:Lantibiotic dehydratase N-terminal domain-containing protein n=1 Tax=Flavobacterium hydrophilum TaxID=2211445 RepID=A0A2V4BW64_9FLAO|nr:lantibiotic dehydratase family protein [Flavobacterium hydrophilum]PXY43248.1 hypothetical protein DMB68_21450 [Flavobacterium hydrophilum]
MDKNIDYTYFEDFIIRTPVYHFEEKEFQTINFEQIFSFFQTDGFFRDAIFVASQVLYNEINKSLDKNCIEERLINSLTKYYVRSRTRCTPFGLFAGCAAGKIGNETDIILKNRNHYTIHTRPDMELVSKLTKYFSSLPEIKKQIKFFPNDTLYPVTDFYSYIESEIVDNKKTYFKSTTENNEYLSAVLDFCNHGRFFAELVEFLVSLDFDKEESVAYVEDLIENQILTNDLEISTIDSNPLKTLILKLDSFIWEKNETVNLFINLSKNLINCFSNTSVEKSPIQWIQQNATIFSFVGHDFRSIFQNDLQLAVFQNTLSESTIKNIQKAINVLKKFTPLTAEDVLGDFKKRFYEKYEEEEILLLRVLDDDFGMGYPYLEEKLILPLLHNVQFKNTATAKTVQWSKKDMLLTRKLSEFFLKDEIAKEAGIEITDQDLDFIDDENNQNLPETLAAIVEIYRDNSNNEFTYISGFSASACKLLGRFSYFDKSVENITKNIIKKEEEYLDKDTIFAEITHLPEAREGNVILRPAITDFEIPILSNSLLPSDKQIQLKDLFLSVKNNRLVLRSNKLNKKIIPRLSSAHFSGHPKNLSFYKFLADLQYQNTQKSIYFDWGVTGQEFKYLPRVIYRGLVLSKAYWNIGEKEINELVSMSKESDYTNKIESWRIQNNIPLKVVIKDTDNKLYIDFNNELFLKIFFNTIKNSQKIILEEVLFTDKNVFVRNEKGECFTNEFIINFYKQHTNE